MSFDMKSARHWARELQQEAIEPGMRVIDATMGNGHDTQWLCELVGETGRVYAFDVQQAAVENTRARLQAAGLLERAVLIHDGHQHVRRYIEEAVDSVLFNLGWLPGGDHRVTTRLETTLTAVNECLQLLKPGGLMTICAYPGHDEGTRELSALVQWARELDSSRYSVMARGYLNQSASCPPVLFAVGKNQTKRGSL